MESFCSYSSTPLWDAKSLSVKTEHIGFLGACALYSLNLTSTWVDLHIIVEWLTKAKEWHRWRTRSVTLLESWWPGHGEFSTGYVAGSKLVFTWDAPRKRRKERIHSLRLRAGAYLYTRTSAVGCHEWFYLRLQCLPSRWISTGHMS